MDEKLRILIVFTDNDQSNPFVKELKRGLEEVGCEVRWSLRDFWKKKGSYDIIHLQWPEYLFGNNADIDSKKVADLEGILTYWKKKAKIIITKHNEKPHFSKGNDIYTLLYQRVYSYLDGVVHLGTSRYEEAKNRNRGIKHHKVIPHHIYTHSYPNEISQTEAREILHIPKDAHIILVFGRVRNKEEQAFLKRILREGRRSGYYYLVPTWFPAFNGKGIKAFLKSLYYKVVLLGFNIRSDVWAGDKFIRDQDVQVYFNAADVVAIPRTDSLNSGIPTLSYFFKKVVVGPDLGNIGMDLKRFDNPVFLTNNASSYAEAMQNGIKMAQEGGGEQNYLQAIKERDPLVIAEMHKSFYNECLEDLYV